MHQTALLRIAASPSLRRIPRLSDATRERSQRSSGLTTNYHSADVKVLQRKRLVYITSIDHGRVQLGIRAHARCPVE